MNDCSSGTRWAGRSLSERALGIRAGNQRRVCRSPVRSGDNPNLPAGEESCESEWHATLLQRFIGSNFNSPATPLILKSKIKAKIE